MSDLQREFIRKLWIVLLSTLGPMIISALVLMGVNLNRIDSNQRRIEAMDKTKVSEQVLLLYVNELRLSNNILAASLNEFKNISTDERQRMQEQIITINTKLDDLMRQIYDVKKRGFPEGYNFDSPGQPWDPEMVITPNYIDPYCKLD